MQKPNAKWLRAEVAFLSSPFYNPGMAHVTISVSAKKLALLKKRAQTSGFTSIEAYLQDLIRQDLAIDRIDQVLVERADGPFAPLEKNWQQLVRTNARKL